MQHPHRVDVMASVLDKVSKPGNAERFSFKHEGRTIYEWEQSLEEVNMYIRPPPGVTSSLIDCKIQNKHLSLGLKGSPPFIDEDTHGLVKVAESFWSMEGGELNINLQKVVKGSTWEAPLKGHGGIDAATKDAVQKSIMLERFQEENPGFDFSQADFNGAAPDPTSFMGGVKYR